MKIGVQQKRLLKWFERNARELPWRIKPSVYGTVVSEFMLQQTQVATVIPYYERWMKSFPDFDSLACATEEAVLKHWEGLGYYRRAKNLNALAQKVSECGLPEEYEGWLSLPGIGPYTAAAVCSIGYGLPYAVVDGNVVRVLSRLYGIEKVFANGGEAVKYLTPNADEFLDRKNPGKFNEAIMELGATVCTRQKPACEGCPLKSGCVAFSCGLHIDLPRIARKAVKKRSINRLWVERKGRLLLQKGSETAGRLANIYELPDAKVLNAVVVETLPLMGTKKRSIANERISENIYRCIPKQGLLDQVREEASLKWVPGKSLDDVTLSGPHRKWIQEFMSSSK